MNSYFYLNTFHGRFPPGATFQQYRNDPKVGMITGVGLMRCTSTDFYSGCQHPVRDPAIDQGQPATNLIGPVTTVRMDGSLASRMRRTAGGTLSYEQLFLFWLLDGRQGSRRILPSP
ncbi:MAG TPA: hypothetical protein VM328_03590 [Fimbriimonadaceae bacterium]|nr:hypothetical protein [Fimbriimonadaceae bacterium]